MINRRKMVALGFLGGFAFTAPLHATAASADCPAAANVEAIGAALLDKYVAAVNAHDTSSFPELFTESYIQHSGRSASGLGAQIENFRKVFAATPDHRMLVEDRIIAGDKVVRPSLRSSSRCTMRMSTTDRAAGWMRSPKGATLHQE